MNFKKNLKTENRLSTKKVYLFLILGVVAACMLGAVPYLISGVSSNYIDALFESVSSFTTTGASTINDASSMPNWLKLYRAFCEWVGGAVSLIVLATALKSLSYDENGLGISSNSANLYRSGITFKTIIKRLLLTYVCLTVLCTAIIWVMGYKPGNALILAGSCVSTGGFPLIWLDESVTNGALTVILVFMLLTCLNYTVYYHVIKKHFARLMNAAELFGFLTMLVAGAIVVVAGLFASGTYDFRQSVFYGIYETVSHASTTGMDIVSVYDWPALSRISLMLISMVGGCSASLASGLKIVRVIILFKVIARGFTTRIHPAATVSIKFDDKKVSGSVISAVFSYFVLYIAAYVVCMFAVSFEAGSLEETFVITHALINNLGGIYTGYFGGVLKILMCFIMLLGRLEFYICMIPFATKTE